MKISPPVLTIPASVLLIFNCAVKQAEYDLPSVSAHEEPEWVETPLAARDTVFLIINLPVEQEVNLTRSVQNAQSELNAILGGEIELILRDYWIGNKPEYSQEQIFELLSLLPVALEKIMNHVLVKDAWERSGQLAVLCGFDSAEVAEIVMLDMNINDPAFLAFFNTRIDVLAQQHQ